MKRLLLATLLAGTIGQNMVGMDSVSTYINPTRLAGFKEQEASRGILQVPAFVNKAKIGRTKTTKMGTRQVVHTKVNLAKALEVPQAENYSITESMENNSEVFTVCIKKSIIPGFDPNLGENNVWGFLNYANVEDKGETWCFTLKNDQGYTKMPSVTK